MGRRVRVHKRRGTPQNGRQESAAAEDGPDVHQVAGEARRRAHRASATAAAFLRRTEKGS
jgi:hypothetical protein